MPAIHGEINELKNVVKEKKHYMLNMSLHMNFVENDAFSFSWMPF